MSFMLAPAFAAAPFQPTPARVWPKPWGTDTTPGRISSEISTGTSIAPTRDATRTWSPSAIPRACASSGCRSAVQRSAPFISRGLLCIHELFDRS